MTTHEFDRVGLKMISSVMIVIAVLSMSTFVLPKDLTRSSAESSWLHVITPGSPQELRELFRYTGEPMHFVAAHRGGSRRGFPENCIETFENTLRHTFAIMEIDPRYTRDGAIVVHHDATLERTTTGKGRVVDLTLRQLRKLRLKDCEGAVTECQIPTLDDVLRWARGRTVLVLDQKDVPVEARVKKIEEHRAEAFAMLIVYNLEDARKCYELNKNIMMEVMIPTREKFHEFDKTGVPWSSIIAFVGHTPPKDRELLKMIHAKGACCMAGTSRNLDRELAADDVNEATSIEERYRALLGRGVDVIETDLPREVGNLLYGESAIPVSKSEVFERQLSPGDFETGADGWDYVGGWEFPGANGLLEWDKTEAHAGEGSLRLDADFSGGGAYVGLWKELPELGEGDIKEIRLWVKSSGVARIGVRIVDDTDQRHQKKRISLRKTDQWQQVVLRLSDLVGEESWGGANDRKWHGPAKSFGLNIGTDGLTSGSKGTLWIDDVSCVLSSGPTRTPTVLPCRLAQSSCRPGYGTYLILSVGCGSHGERLHRFRAH